MRKVRKDVLITTGNQALYTADQDVFDESGTPYANVGQIVIYDPTTLKSVGVGVTPANNDRITVAVPYMENGVKVLRKAFGDHLFSHNVDAWNVSTPACGQGEIKNFFAKCLTCNEDYSLEIGVLNDDIESQFSTNRTAKYPFTVPINCCVCNDCADNEVDGTEVFRRIVDQINGVLDTDRPRTAYFNQPLSRLTQKSFFAIQLYKGDGDEHTVQEYCITPVKNACDNCIDAEELVKSLSYTDADSETVTVDFDNTGDAEGGTPVGKFGYIADKINSTLGYVAATITKGTGTCCSSKLIISLNPDVVTDFKLFETEAGAETPEEVTVCDSYNPFADGNTDYNGGMMVISKPTPLRANKCYGPNPPTSNPVSEIQIFPKGGFTCGSTKVVNHQNISYPRGLGYYLAWEEYMADNGGTGRNHEPYNRSFGPLGLPHGNDRANSVASAFNEFYCEYIIEHTLPSSSISVMGKGGTKARGVTIIGVPSTDDVTRAGLEAVLNPYMAAMENIVLDAVVCDQDENDDWEPVSYPNGRIN